ncbi:MAG: hypothetical protein EA359_03225 [Balneolaceae bacterium]|nr:MAG: hypothetical protein EA359_03225 [Balneolaceae bacterium]
MTMPSFRKIFVFLPAIVFLLSPVSVAFQMEPLPNQFQGLFDSEEILEITLEGDIRTLQRDRGSDPSNHPMKLHVKGEEVEEYLDLRVRVRGNFRRLRDNCRTPPLRLNFNRHPAPDHSLFAGQSTLKLVVPCQGDQYVLREYLTYKLYNLFTEHSFRARLVRLTYHDTENDRKSDPEYAFILEHINDVVSRNNAQRITRLQLRPEVVDQAAFLRMSVFEYLIGNTDWSIQYLQNINMLFLEDEKIYVAVPYDFDLAGLVSAPYAKPEEALKLSSVRERRFRGYCLEDLSVLEPVFEQFRELKPEIYKVITENPLLEASYINFATRYLDDFYDTINDPRKMSRDFSYPCNRRGTGNVVITGMQN